MIEYINGIPHWKSKRFTWKRTTTQGMGRIEAAIELINSLDLIEAAEHNIGEDEIRRYSCTSLVDTGSQYLCINENIQQVLQLRKIGTKRVMLANDQPIECDFVGPVEIKFKNRTVECAKVIVLPGGAEPLLGLLPLEEMDVVIVLNRNELIVNPDHPDYAVHRI
jgi:clan AA aspartic protease